MDSSIEEIEFLTRSEHRPEVLDALTEHPQSRADLRSLTGASSSTIGRMLEEFEAKYWITRIDHRYEATPLGAFVAEGLAALRTHMETERALREAMRWLPIDEVDFDIIECLRDAEVVFPTDSDPTAPIRHAGEQLRDGTQLRFLTTQVTVSYFDTMIETVERNRMRVEGVLTPAARDSLMNDSTMAVTYRGLCESGDADFFVTEGVPLIFQIIDDAVGIGLVDKAKNPQGLILSDDEAVHQWAVDTFETYRKQAKPVGSS